MQVKSSRWKRKICGQRTHTPYWSEPPIAAGEMKVRAAEGPTEPRSGGGASAVGGAKALPASGRRVISVRRGTEKAAGGVAGGAPRAGILWSQAASERRSGTVSVGPSRGCARVSRPWPWNVGVRRGTERGVVAWETARVGGRREGGISGAFSGRRGVPGWGRRRDFL